MLTIMAYRSRSIFPFVALLASFLPAQSLGNAGTLAGTVHDPTGAVVTGAAVELLHPVTSFRVTTRTDSQGAFRFGNLPFNPYALEVRASGFALFHRDLEVRSTVPLTVKIELALPGTRTTMDVEALGAEMLENVPVAHTDIDQRLFHRLPAGSAASGLSDVLMLAAPGIVADSNGFFHPLGDHAQTSFVIDGQPVNDQQSKTFSTQLPLNAIEAIEAVTGAPNAEFGDKTSLVVVTTTRSALGADRAFGSFHTQYGSFGSPGVEATLGTGTKRFGNFLALSAARTGRFLDTPEFRPYHAIGNSATIFDRLDFQPGAKQSLHLKILGMRNWFQTPNTLDQPDQDQRQRATTGNVALGWTYAPTASTLWSVNPFVRQDRLHYYPSPNVEDDSPITLGQDRHLTNWGVRSDLSAMRGRHNLKFGVQAMQTKLKENFFLGVTDFGYNPVCLDGDDEPAGAATVLDPRRCAAAGLKANPELLPGLVPFDLSRGGRLFRFHGAANINQAAAYVQDSVRWGGLNISAGLRFDRYAGLSSDHSWQPRLGLSYQIKPTGTVLRASYSRTFETPYNENLILSSATGSGGLALNVFGAETVEPIRPGKRNQFNVGFQQALSRWVVAEGDYFWKYTRNAYDFGALLTTPLVFPISWDKSKLSGVSLRLSSREIRGFQAYATMAHANARFFLPSSGGLIYTGDLEAGVFRIDHDQAFNSTTHVRYQPRRFGWYGAYTWRFDSGLVSGEIGSYQDALALPAAQQSAIGLYCGSTVATPGRPLTGCAENQAQGASRYRIPYPEAQDDHNPPRVAARHLHNISVGTENLLHGERGRMTLRFSIANLANREALYNFLSPFGGTHFVAPRTLQAQIGWVF